MGTAQYQKIRKKSGRIDTVGVMTSTVNFQNFGLLDQVKLVYPRDQQANLIILSHQARQEQLDSWQLGSQKNGKKAQKRLKLDQKKKQSWLLAYCFVASCDMYLDISPKILSLKWSRVCLIIAGNTKILYYATVAPRPKFSGIF